MNEPLSSQNSDHETGMPPEHLSAGGLRPGTVISGFRIEREIGRGGMGVVYLATQLNLQRYAALKILADELSGNTMFVERFFQEAHSAACLSHSNIVQAYDAGVASGLCYFAMEFVDGETLDVLLRREGALPARSVMDIGHRIACALDHAWQTRGMCHGDIKPDNILIGRNGELKLADLGLAKSIYDEDVPRDVMVTPLYAAPEIISGKVTEPNLLSDIYSFGALLYHAATGAPPFNSEPIEEIYRRHLEELPVPPVSLNPSIPGSLSSLILRMLEKNPEKRPASWKEIMDSFLSMLEEPEAPAEPQMESRKKISFKYLFLFLLIPVLILSGFGILRVFRSSPSPKHHAVRTISKSLPENRENLSREKEPVEEKDPETGRSIQTYLRTTGSFCSMMRFAPCFGPAETEKMLRICRFLILQGTLPHLAGIRGRTEPDLKIAEQILAARSRSFRTPPRIVSKKKTIQKKRKVIRKKTDHNALLFRILTKYRSNPQSCREKLEEFGERCWKTAPLQSKQAHWIAEAMTPPDELHSLFLNWNQFLKGLPMSDFGTSCELYEVNQNFMYLQFRDGIMRLRRKYPPSQVNMLKIRKALMREAYRSDFRNRFPDEIQRYAVIRLLFTNPADGSEILSQLSPRMQKELAPIKKLIERSAKP